MLSRGQALFSVLIGNKATAPYYVHCVLGCLLGSGLAHFVMMAVGVPRAGLVRQEGRGGAAVVAAAH